MSPDTINKEVRHANQTILGRGLFGDRNLRRRGHFDSPFCAASSGQFGFDGVVAVDLACHVFFGADGLPRLRCLG